MGNIDNRSRVRFSTDSRESFDKFFSSFFECICSDEVLAGFPETVISAPSNTAKSFVVDIGIGVATGNVDVKETRRHSCLEDHCDQAADIVQKQFLTAAGKAIAVQFTNLVKADLDSATYVTMRQGLRSMFSCSASGLTFISNPKLKAEKDYPSISIHYDFSSKSDEGKKRGTMWEFEGEVRVLPEIASQRQLQEIVHSR